MTLRDSGLAHVRVHEAMHTGILTTEASTPLHVVAQLMADQHVHAVAVSDPGGGRRPWGIVTALGIAAAAADGVERSAGEAVASEVLTVSASDPLDYAARVMVEHATTHLIVVDPASGHPAGIISTLDVVAAYAAST